MASKTLLQNSPFGTLLFSLFLLMANFTNVTNAQTWSSCNPMVQTDCPPNLALGIDNATFPFVNGTFDDKIWNTTAGKTTYSKDVGRSFTVNKRGDSPTIQSNFYIFFGRASIVMRAATGTGIVSSIVLQSDDLDEVDWEWIGGNNTHVQTNYFGKGNTTSYDRAFWHPVSDPQNQFHNYSVTWTPEKLDWYIDGNLIRTLNYGDAVGGKNFPQTPMNVRLGIWAGGDKDNNKYTIDWAGGLTNYDKGPYSMVVQNVEVADFTTAAQYVWSDKSGSFQSIKAVAGNSKAAERINEPQGVVNKFNALTPTAKIGIAAGAGTAALGLVLLIGVCCFKQRRRGRSERKVADAEFEKNASELQAYRSQMQQGGFAIQGGQQTYTGQNHPQQPQSAYFPAGYRPT